MVSSTSKAPAGRAERSVGSETEDHRGSQFVDLVRRRTGSRSAVPVKRSMSHVHMPCIFGRIHTGYSTEPRFIAHLSGAALHHHVQRICVDCDDAVRTASEVLRLS